MTTKNRPKHYFLAEDLLTPNVNKTDGSRLNMFLAHCSQFLTLNEGETPRIFTRFENLVGEHSKGMGHVKIPEDCTFAADIIVGESERYIFLAFEDMTVDVIHYCSVTRLTEDYGYANKFCMTDANPGDELKKDTLVSHNTMYDDALNLQYGKNLKAIYLAYKGLTFEDGIVISESASKKLNHTSVSEAVVNINNNDVLVNLYGDKNNYKPFPNVGEVIDNGILCSRRRLNYSSVMTDFKENDHDVDPSIDTIFFFEGTVESVEVFTNLTDEELEMPHNTAVKALVMSKRDLWKDIERTIIELKDAGYTLRDNCGNLLQKAKDFNSKVKFSYDKSEYEGTIIRFKIRKEIPLKVGSKISNR